MSKNLLIDVTKEQVQRAEAKLASLIAWTLPRHYKYAATKDSNASYSPSTIAGPIPCARAPCYITSTKNSQGLPIAILKLFLLADMLSGT